jgi:hypothetical protein
VPCGQQEFAQIADVVVMVMCDEYGVNLLGLNAHFYHLGGHPTTSIKQEPFAVDVNQTAPNADGPGL